ncbi:tandem-95 repeat protein, partial [Gammaproteobacteria bacterium]|nr:tandem-95 repeat protein [Gammaproteobacteria bacterium]
MNIIKLLPITFSILFIVSCGGGGGGGGSTPTPPTTPAPTVNLSAEPTSVLLENTSTLTWSSTNATSCSATWTTQTGSSGSEAVSITTAGNNSFSISCTGDGGTRSASVTVEGYRNTDGVVVDGYISGAEVCIDENDSWTCDASENSTTSDNEGKFTIRYANGNLVSIGGTDLDSQTLLDNLLITHKLTGHSDFKAVTPVTSVAAFMTDASSVNSALGIDSSIDVSTFDPVANKGDGGINDYLYEKGNQLTVLAYALQNITNDLNTSTETTQDYFKAITEEIEKEYTETETKVDIETEEFIAKTLDNIVEAKTVTITDEAKANTTKALSGVMPVIEVKSSDDLTTSVIRFAVSTLQTDIQAIANGTASEETVASYTTDVLIYIATDQNIDANEITPDISAITDSATTSEDTSVTINVVLNDSYLTSAPISVSAGNGSNGTTTLAESSPEQIVYTPNADYNGTDTFSYTITQGDKTSSADVSITVEAVNDAPSIDSASTIQVAENQTAVATISVSDVDEDDLTLTLSGTDADSFDLSTDNVLTFKEAPDFETKSSYSITLTLTDGTETVTKDITISVANLNDNSPIFTSSASFSEEENQTAIGTVTATDADGDGITFTISGSELVITPAGVLTFVSAPDYETKSSYTATVTATDGTLTTAQNITVSVTNLNDNSPVFTSSTTFSAAEDQTAIGTVTATDADGDGITFTISGSELVITPAGVLTFVSAPDYETKSSYTATVTATDGTLTTTQDITVLIVYVFEQATHWESHQEKLEEIQTVYTNPIGFNIEEIWFKSLSIPKNRFTTTKFDYSLDDENFRGQVGVDTWFTDSNKTFFFSCNWVPNKISEGAIKVFEYTDGEFSQFIYKEIEGCNHPFSLQNTDGTYQHIFLGLDEGKIGSELAPDGPTYSFDLASGTFTDLGFRIGSHGQAVFDYEGDGDQDIISNDYTNIVSNGNPFILRNDGNNNFTAVTVPLPDYKEQQQVLYGNMSAAAFYDGGYLKVVYTDFDTSQMLDNRWGIEPRQNVVVTYDQNTLDVITVTQLPSPYSELNFINLDAYDGSSSFAEGNGLSHDVRSTTIDIDYDGDIDIIIGSQVYGEKISLPQILINNNGVYQDETATRLFNWMFATGSIHRWDFADVNGDGYLDIITKDGCIGVYTKTDGSFIEAKPYGCERKIAINDGDGHFVAIIEPTQIMQTFYNSEFKTYTINPIFGMDSDRNMSWVSMDGKDCNGCYADGKFEIFTTKLEGSLSTGPAGMDPAILGEAGFNEFYYLMHNPEAKSAVSDGLYQNGLEHYIAIGKDLGYKPNAKSQTNIVVDSYGVNPVHAVVTNLAPIFSSEDSFTVDENQTSIATITATDPEGEAIVYSVSGAELEITTSGVLSFKAEPDYETKSSYTATVTASDDVYYKTQDITVNIINLNDSSPVFTSSTTFSSAENQTNIGTVTATDADGDSVTFTVSGSELAITSAGVLTFVSAPDFETKTSYTATVTASDGVNTTTQDITVNVTNVNDVAPVFTSEATFSAAENQTAIGSVVATDAEGDEITFTVSGSELAITSAGVLTFKTAPDYETKSSYTATVTATDGTNSTTQDITVNVTDVNEMPVFSPNGFTINENLSSLDVSSSVSDEDGDTITYSLGGGDGGLFNISSAGVLTLKTGQDFDYELRSSYSFQIGISDGTNSQSPMISIEVNNLNDNSPVFTSSSTLSAAENQTSIDTVTA